MLTERLSGAYVGFVLDRGCMGGGSNGLCEYRSPKCS